MVRVDSKKKGNTFVSNYLFSDCFIPVGQSIQFGGRYKVLYSRDTILFFIKNLRNAFTG